MSDHLSDEAQLAQMGYPQELHRSLSGFSNLAISLSIICILAGGVTSFHQGLCSVGGASIGLGWPLCCLFSLAVAATMSQVASAFPTAGGLYHWAAILGGRGWGWATAWFNLAGLLFVLAAINVGTYEFCVNALGKRFDFNPLAWEEPQRTLMQMGFMAAITLTQALCNHFGIRLTTRLTDFSGYLIVIVAALLTVVLLIAALPHLDLTRLITFSNFSGLPQGDPNAWPDPNNLFWLFLLGLMLPAYTVTGFDASAHVAEETLQAARAVPRGIMRSVLVSGVFGWAMLCAVILAATDLRAAAEQGNGAFVAIVDDSLAPWLALALYGGIAVAQYLCGLATVTSASRMLFAFARDGGTPGASLLRRVSARHRTPVPAIWTVTVLAVALTVYGAFYNVIAVTAALFLYISYALPTALGLFAYRRSWTRMGPWDLGRWYRPLAVLSLLGTVLLFVIGIQPPNQKSLQATLLFTALLLLVWLGWERRRFRGPPTLTR